MNGSSLLRSRPVLVVAVILVVVVVAAAAFALFGRPSSKPSTPTTSSISGEQLTAPSAESSGSVPTVQESPSATGSTSSPSATPSGTAQAPGKTPSSPKAPSNPSANPTGSTPPPPAGTFYLKLMWWNDAPYRPARGFEIVWDGGSWKPSGSKRSQTTLIGPFPVGRRLVMTVYPDGKSGAADRVPFKITPTMVSGSDMDVVHVAVSDNSLLVLGNAIENAQKEYARSR